MPKDRELSDRGRELLAMLGPPVAPMRKPPAQHAAVEVLAELRELGEPAALPGLFPFTLVPEALISSMAVDVAAHLLQLMPPSSLPWLDERMRSWTVSGSWPERSLTMFGLEEPDSSVVRLGSMDRNGRVRQAAVERLVRCLDGSELPYLLLRKNDWVAKIRDLAGDALSERLSLTRAAAWAAALPLVIRLRRCGRELHEPFVEDVLTLLNEPEARPFVLVSLRSPDRTTRREACRVLLSGDPVLVREALEVARQTDDPVTRLWLSRAALASVGAEGETELLDELWADRFTPIKALSIEARFNQDPEKALPFLRSGLLSPSGAVRGMCQYYFGKRLSLDAPEVYRSVLSEASSRDTLAALLGLAEVGGSEDVGHFLKRTGDPRSAIRAAAVRGVALRGTHEHVDVFWTALEDPSGPVLRYATKGVTRVSGPVPPERVLALLKPDASYALSAKAVRLARGVSKAEALVILLQARQTSERRLKGLIDRELRHWLVRANRGAIGFSPALADRALDALAWAAPELPRDVQGALRLAIDVGRT